MIRFLLHRLGYMALTLLLVSFVSFLIIQAAPGDYAEIYAAKKAATGAIITQADVEAVRRRARPRPAVAGRSTAAGSGTRCTATSAIRWAWRRPVGEVIAERLPLTLVIAFTTLFFMYAVSIPVGIYSAVYRYSVGDYALGDPRLCRPRDPELPPRARAALSGAAAFRLERRRALLAGVREGADGAGPSSRISRAHLVDPGLRARRPRAPPS